MDQVLAGLKQNHTNNQVHNSKLASKILQLKDVSLGFSEFNQ